MFRPQAPAAPNGKTTYAVLSITLTTLRDLADAVPVPGLKVALGGILSIVVTAEAKRRNVDDLKALDAQLLRLKHAIIEPLIGTRSEDLSDALRKRIEELCSDLEDIVTNKKKLASRGGLGGFWFASDDAITIAELQEKIKDALSRFLVGGMITQELLTVRKMKQEEDRRSSELVNGLPRAEAAWNSRQRNSAIGCLEGTREALLETIYDWVKDTDPFGPRIFWLTGLAGTGKSSVAHTVAEYCHRGQLLGASFFFSRDQADRSDPRLVFSTIAHQLSTFHYSFKTLIAHALEADLDLGRANARTQLQKLITEPLQRASGVSSPVVVVMDALDECSQERDASELLKLLAAAIPKLPIQFKLFITSRPERHISRQFDSMTIRRISSLSVLHDIESSVVQSDIELFLRHRLADIAVVRGYSSWPSQGEVKALADKAGNLFIFASTAVKYIEDNGKHQLNVLLHVKARAGSSPDQTSFQELDALYSQVIRSALRGSFRRSLCSDLSDFQAVVGAIVLLLDPLSSQRLAILLGVDMDSVTDALWGMESVIMIPESDDQVVRIIHPSFHDFLTNQSRCADPMLFVDASDHHGRLAVCCLNRMVSCLRQNICKIGDSSMLNSEVPDLKARLEAEVSLDLQYSCFHWASHLSLTPPRTSPLKTLTSFCFKHLLHWLEVLSLLGRLDLALPSLRYARKWSTVAKAEDELIELLSDAERFVVEFFEPIAVSAQQVYYSALPFTPTATLLAKSFTDDIQSAVKVLAGVPKAWNPCLRVLEGHSDSVTAVIYSPDGSRIVSTSLDNTLRLWDTTTGAFITSLDGHTNIVNAVAISPDGSRIVSGSDDETLRFWDAITGIIVASAAHSSSVTAVAFSPDGNYVVSGSEDGTLQLWNAITGVSIASLKGHSGRVTTVAFSPVGSHIVSGSNDSTLRLWDATTGNFIASLEGHSFRVNTVAFSPDGCRVVSGSDDSTLRLWDVAGCTIASLEGHSYRVTTVAFSPKGSHIASGSADGSLRLWEGTTGAFIASIQGHAHIITAIAFSPDGNRVVSGSYDGSVRLWDVTTGSSIASLMGHSSIVTAVMYSPDGCRVVSGSVDNTLRLWDVTTGVSTTFFDGHSDHVMTLAFSPGGRHIFSGSVDHTLRLWNSTTGASIASLNGHSDIVRAVAFSPDGRHVVSGSDDSTVKLWDANTGALIASFEGHSDRVTTIAFSPDGSRVVSGSVDNTLQLWDTTTKTSITSLDGHSDYIITTSFSPDGRSIISGSYDCTLRLWDALTGTFIVSFQGHSKVITTATFSPESDLVASASDDTTVRIWDTTTGTTIMTLHGHSYRTTIVVFSPDKKYLVSGSDDDTLRLWDLKTGVPIALLTFSPPLISGVEFSSDGGSIIINDQSQLRFWALPPTAAACTTLSASAGKTRESTEVVKQTLRNQWLMAETQSGCRRICWVPLDSRGLHQLSHGPTVIIGGDRGRITIVDCSAFR